jgi:hypothetical protein
LKRLEESEERCNQLEITLKDTVTFATLAARLTGKTSFKRRQAMRKWSPEEKKPSLKEWLLLVWQKKRLIRKLPSPNQPKRKPIPGFTVI